MRRSARRLFTRPHSIVSGTLATHHFVGQVVHAAVQGHVVAQLRGDIAGTVVHVLDESRIGGGGRGRGSGRRSVLELAAGRLGGRFRR